MKNQSLVDLFDAYDKAFDKACHELGITNIPDWRERWFYRFLLINPVWKYAPVNILSDRHRHPDLPKINIEEFFNGLYESSELIADKKYTKLLENSNAGHYSEVLNPCLFENFCSWWFYAGKKRIRYSTDIKEINFWNHLEKWYLDDDTERNRYERWKDTFSKEIEELFELTNDLHFVLLIPKFGPKKEIIKQVNQALNKNHIEKFHIRHNKITEKTVKDCFRILEYQILNGKKNLLEIAKDTDILRISKANLYDKHGRDSANSVKVGVHRLSNLAMEIMNASSYSFFPTLDGWSDLSENVQAVNEVLKDYFKLVKKDTISKIRSKLPVPNDMYSQICLDLERLGEIVFED
jgi:hypothetical protein